MSRYHSPPQSLIELRRLGIEGDQTALYLSDTLQDRAAKFVDQLSAIGGTMGLLTGFSLISGVEILYFTVKIVINIMRATPVKTV